MKYIKYYLALLLSAMTILLPCGAVAFFVYIKPDKTGLVISCIIAVIGISLAKPAQALRIKYRRETEYDEFGRSKTKGNYERLSKKERDEIDLQKTLDMERLVDSTAIKKMTKRGSASPDADMENLVGLIPVKTKIKEMTARMKFEREEQGKKKNDSSSMSGRHMVFYGSPGTGKTTVARIITGFLYQYGYIKENKCIEVDGNYLKAGGDTATKTELIIRQAFGGVLFIDEAYVLMDSGDGSGEQAIATLIKQMEDNRNRFILIMAGYTNEMHRLLASNPGFSSRIKEYLEFPDYDDGEMREIFRIMAADQNFAVENETYSVFDERIKKERKLRTFGNGRTVRNIVDEAIDKHALNYMEGRIAEDNKFKLCACDISTKVKTAGI